MAVTRLPTRPLVPGTRPVAGRRRREGSGVRPGDEPPDAGAKSKDSPARPDRADAGKKPRSSAEGGPRTKASDAPPAVLSKDDEARRKRSPFLLPPGSSPSDRYDPDVESTDPPWRQTSFFGIRARGQFFVYVVDWSGSMIDDDRLTRAKIELRRSVLRLAAAAAVQGHLLQRPGHSHARRHLPRPADLQSKNQLSPGSA